MELENKILSKDEIYEILITALIEKTPLPPDDWCASKLDEEIRIATREIEPNPFLRQKDALETSLCYLVDYALRMPERLNLTETNNRVKEMCEELAFKIVKITSEPESVIEKHGKLKSWLSAILSVQTCLIYCGETDRYNAEQDEAKRLSRLAQAKKKSLPIKPKSKEKWKSDLAKSIFQKASKSDEKSTEQPSLF